MFLADGAETFLADNAETAGAIAGRIFGIGIGVVALVIGVRLLRRPPRTRGRRGGGIVLVVVGVLFLLASLVALTNGTATGQ